MTHENGVALGMERKEFGLFCGGLAMAGGVTVVDCAVATVAYGGGLTCGGILGMAGLSGAAATGVMGRLSEESVDFSEELLLLLLLWVKDEYELLLLLELLTALMLNACADGLTLATLWCFDLLFFLVFSASAFTVALVGAATPSVPSTLD